MSRKGSALSSVAVAVLTITVSFILGQRMVTAVPLPGPDRFGYTAAPIDFRLRDLTASPSSTRLSLSDDQIVPGVPIGFEFDFYGLRYDQASIASNGYIVLGQRRDLAKHATEIPSPDGPANFIAGVYTDLFFLPPELKPLLEQTGEVYYETQGPPGSREFVIGFYDVQEFGGDARYTFETILHEGSQNIELQIDAAPRGVESFSIGIENATSDDGLSIVSNVGSGDELDRCGGACDPTSLDNVGFLLTHPTGTLGPRPPQYPGIPIDDGNDPANFLDIRQAGGSIRWKVGVTTTVTHDGVGGVDPYAYHGPALTVYDGEFVDPASDDAYDRANIVAVALPGQQGEAIRAPTLGADPGFSRGTVTTLPSGATLVQGDRYRMDNGLDASLSYYFSDQAAVVRTLVQLTNNTANDVANAVVNFANPMGTDAATWVIATDNNPVGGDPTQVTDRRVDPPSETFRYEDRWIITDENPALVPDGQEDPATTHVYFGPEGLNTGWDGGGPKLALNGAPDDPDDIYTLLLADLPRGETTTWMFFSELSPTHRQALAGTDKYGDLDRLREAGLLEGIPVGTMIYNWGPVRTALLQAGDADQDLDFDQRDIVRVQIAGKYLTGAAATWGQGDWNGAPGGRPGDPPPGDGRFDQNDVVAALAGGLYLAGPYAAVPRVSIPEPSAGVLGLLALLGFVVRRIAKSRAAVDLRIRRLLHRAASPGTSSLFG